MFIALVHVYVKPDQVDRFIDLIRVNHDGSIQEPGCIRFDVGRSVDDPTQFALWEWYLDADAAQAHKETPHYLAFKAAAAEMMAEERVSVRYGANVGMCGNSATFPRSRLTEQEHGVPFR